MSKVAWLARDLAPRPSPVDFPPLRSLLPRGWLHWTSAVLLVVVVGVYLGSWVAAHPGFLFDPDLQTDDARTSLFAFHRYGPEGAMADDPIANDMIAFAPVGWWAMYRVLVPTVGLFVSTKIVQLFCLAILLYAGWLMLRSSRVGLAAAMLTIFFTLHTPWIVSRISGGMSRGFAFPLFALWAAGVMTHSRRARLASALLATVIYPSAMMLILGAEGIIVLMASRRPDEAAQPWGGIWTRARRYVLLVAACGLLTVPFMARSTISSVYTLEQAKSEPAFRTRLSVLPLPDPIKEFARYFVVPYHDTEARPKLDIAKTYRSHGSTGSLVFVGLLMILPLTGLAVAPRATIAFIGGAIGCYIVARLFAFRLYSPSRYYSYAMPAACIMLTVSSIGLLLWRRNAWWVPPLRNGLCCAFIGIVLLLTGSGLRRDNMMTINRNRDAPLYDFVKRLPVESRIAAHPNDADDIPLWAGRPMTGGYETIHPWLAETWKRMVRRTHAVFNAMYATRPKEVLDFCRRYKVTHFLIDRSKYRNDFRAKARFFEPFGAYTRKLLARRRREQLVFATIDPSTIIYKRGSRVLLEVKRLERAWKKR